MKTLLSLALVAASIAAGPAFAACTYPKKPGPAPDGNIATLPEMLAAAQGVRAFNDAIVTYQSCLEENHKAALAADPSMPPEEIKKTQDILNKRLDESSKELDEIAALVNEQIRVYKTKNPSK